MRAFLFSTMVAGTIGVVGFPSRAFAASDVRLSFSPSSLTAPPTRTVQLVAELESSPLAFAHVEISFDPQLVSVTEQITTTPLLATVVRKTTADDANRTGRIVLALALPPVDNDPPTGTVTLAEMSLTSVNQEKETETLLQIDAERTQLFTHDERQLSFNSTPLSIAARPNTTPTRCRDALRPRITSIRDVFGWLHAIWNSCTRVL